MWGLEIKTHLDHFINPAHSSYYPGFPLNISIVVSREGVSYMPIVLCTFGGRFLGRTLLMNNGVLEY